MDRSSRKAFFLPHFGYSLPLFSSLLKKRGKKNSRMNRKNRDQKSCLSARSFRYYSKIALT